MGFNRVSSRAQVEISSLPFHVWVVADGSVCTQFFRNGHDYLLRFPGIVDFEVSADGLGLLSHAVPGIRDDTVEHLYINQVLPLALSRQGKLVFHASAVEAADGAIAFMGVSGRGKSTLAASFAGSGLRFLTDDGLLLENSVDGYLVQPSHPSIRLWDDSRQALIHETATLASPVQHTPKARILSDDLLSFCDQPRRLHRAYFLGNGSASQVSIERIKPSDALIGLVNHSFLLDIEARDVIAKHFDELTQLVKMPIFYSLDFPRRFDYLPAVREAVLWHATQA